MSRTKIFRYMLADAWGGAISEVKVFQASECGYIRCKLYDHIVGKNGVLNYFDLNLDDIYITSIRASNLWIFAEDSKMKEYIDKEPVKARYLLSAFDEICSVLMKYGVTKEYLALDM